MEEVEGAQSCARGWDMGDEGPQVTVTWMDGTYTDMLVHPGVGFDEWAAVLPSHVRPKLLCGITVAGMREGEVLVLTDVRPLRVDLMTAAIGRGRWWWWWQLVRRRVWR